MAMLNFHQSMTLNSRSTRFYCNILQTKIKRTEDVITKRLRLVPVVIMEAGFTTRGGFTLLQTAHPVAATVR